MATRSCRWSKRPSRPGIVVVGEFTPIGTDYGTIEPQVEGMTSYVGTSIVDNGEGLAELGLMACE